MVGAAQHLVRRPVAQRERADRAAQLAHGGRRLHPVPLHIADDQGEPVPGLDDVVPVAAHVHALGARQIASRGLHPRMRRQPAGQQRLLQTAGEGRLVVVAACPFHRVRDQPGERGEDRYVPPCWLLRGQSKPRMQELTGRPEAISGRKARAPRARRARCPGRPPRSAPWTRRTAGRPVVKGLHPGQVGIEADAFEGREEALREARLPGEVQMPVLEQVDGQPPPAERGLGSSCITTSETCRAVTASVSAMARAIGRYSGAIA